MLFYEKRPPLVRDGFVTRGGGVFHKNSPDTNVASLGDIGAVYGSVVQKTYLHVSILDRWTISYGCLETIRGILMKNAPPCFKNPQNKGAFFIKIT